MSSYYENFNAIKKLYASVITPVAESFGLTNLEMHVLLFLSENPQNDTAACIVDMCHLAKSHVSTSVRSLMKNGFLVGTSKTGDRRAVHLALCPKAESAIREGRLAQNKVAQMLLFDFSEEERRMLLHYLSRVVENAHALKPGNCDAW